jgi:tellurite resistance protein TerC
VTSLLDWLVQPAAGAPAWAWLLFVLIVFALLALDLGVLHREDREIGIRESLWTSALYILAALGFAAWIGASFGSHDAIAFLTGYFIEKSLSLDNIFVISLIFGYLAVPRELQHRVLFWGIIGVLVMRAILIGLGTALVHEWQWLLPVFVALVLIECADAVFALESVPAILAITQEPYIVYTSNIFAVLGLRALYFALAALVQRFAYLKHTLALILIFIGGKIFVNQFGGHIPPAASLAVTLLLLAGGVGLSLWKLRQARPAGSSRREVEA